MFLGLSIEAIIAVAMTNLMVSGGFDMSVGSILAFTGAVTAKLLVSGIPVPVAVLAGIVIGGAIGLFNGFVVAIVRSFGTGCHRDGREPRSRSIPVAGACTRGRGQWSSPAGMLLICARRRKKSNLHGQLPGARVVSHGPDSRPARRSIVCRRMGRTRRPTCQRGFRWAGRAFPPISTGLSSFWRQMQATTSRARHSWSMEAYLLALLGLFQKSSAYSAIVCFAVVGAMESKRRMQ